MTLVSIAAMPQPMSTPTAAGMIAPSVAMTERDLVRPLRTLSQILNYKGTK